MEAVTLCGAPWPCDCAFTTAVPQRAIGHGSDSTTLHQCDHIARKLRRRPKDKYIRRATQREIDVFTKLGSHARIVEFYGHIELESLFLKIYKNRDLQWFSTKINRNEISLPSLVERWRWVLDVAEGLRYLYSKNIMHCDISTPNILISDSGKHAVLCDFETSYIKGRKVLHATGTPGFTRFVQYDPPSIKQDLFAFGCLTFFILTGRLPYSEIFHPDLCCRIGDHSAANDIVKRKFAAEEYPALPEEVPPETSEHILKCWKGDYESMKEVVKDVKEDMAGLKSLTVVDPWRGFDYMSREKLGELAALTPLPED